MATICYHDKSHKSLVCVYEWHRLTNKYTYIVLHMGNVIGRALQSDIQINIKLKV